MRFLTFYLWFWFHIIVCISHVALIAKFSLFYEIMITIGIYLIHACLLADWHVHLLRSRGFFWERSILKSTATTENETHRILLEATLPQNSIKWSHPVRCAKGNIYLSLWDPMWNLFLQPQVAQDLNLDFFSSSKNGTLRYKFFVLGDAHLLTRVCNQSTQIALFFGLISIISWSTLAYFCSKGFPSVPLFWIGSGILVSGCQFGFALSLTLIPDGSLETTVSI